MDDDYSADQLIEQVNNPDCPFVGPYLKNRHAAERGLDTDTATDIEELLWQHGILVNGDGLAVRLLRKVPKDKQNPPEGHEETN